jgi:hypothetical protein
MQEWLFLASVFLCKKSKRYKYDESVAAGLRRFSVIKNAK